MINNNLRTAKVKLIVKALVTTKAKACQITTIRKLLVLHTQENSL